jgi:hypothetical protein
MAQALIVSSAFTSMMGYRSDIWLIGASVAFCYYVLQ